MMRDFTSSKEQKISLDKTIELTNKYTKDLIKILLKTDGEKIIGGKFEGDIDVFNFLKTSYAEKLKPDKFDFINDRNLPYRIHFRYLIVETHEKLMGSEIEVSKRAVYLRTILLEIERLYSHFEIIISLAKHLSYPILISLASQAYYSAYSISDWFNNNRNSVIFMQIGGTADDIDDKDKKKLLNIVSKIENLASKIFRKIKRSAIIKDALSNTGFITRENAKKLGLSGPIARSTGITYDIRKSDPYAAYNDLHFSIPVYDSCDLYGSVMVRLDEIFQSIYMIKQLIDRLPDGQHYNSPPDYRLPSNNALIRVESPFGEFHLFSISKNSTLKDYLRTFELTSPFKMNGQGLLARLVGDEVDNIPLIISEFSNGCIL
jgi:Ni,Fe-hydrogenase III large subunit